MADTKDGGGFFRKVVRFVANPATDWNDIQTNRLDEHTELERSELQAMVERKRRNDFVRKREFDMLRKMRRDGLSPEQLAALGNTSRVDDSEVSGMARSDSGGVKAKIDEIEQQMVGDGPAPGELHNGGRRPQVRPSPAGPSSVLPGESPRRERPPPSRLPEALSSRPEAMPLPSETPANGSGGKPGAPLSSFPRLDLQGTGPSEHPQAWAATTNDVPRLPDLPPLPPVAGAGPTSAPVAPAPAARTRTGAVPAPAPSAAQPPAPRAPDAPARVSTPARLGGLSDEDNAVEVSEVVHDPELDEAVIAFANGDFAHCEVSLDQLRRRGGPRHQHAETWLVLFDLYRAVGQQPKFEALALDYANLFGRSAPQWFSLPKLAAEPSAADEVVPSSGSPDVSWASPAQLDAEAVARLRSGTERLPMPWVLDFAPVQQVAPDAAEPLTRLLRHWAGQKLEMRWQGVDRLLQALAQAAPTGERRVNPAMWMARLEALRLMNRPDRFDEVAIDYCVTYEVSPPSFEHARCTVRATSGTQPSQVTSVPSEASSLFAESAGDDSFARPGEARVELSGQLTGDISAVLQRFDRQLGDARLVQVSCGRLIRVDFPAAGDLLNWVLAKNGQERSVTFSEAHRLVALFFGAMGINEHARVQVPRL